MNAETCVYIIITSESINHLRYVVQIQQSKKADNTVIDTIPLHHQACAWTSLQGTWRDELAVSHVRSLIDHGIHRDHDDGDPCNGWQSSLNFWCHIVQGFHTNTAAVQVQLKATI